jgi:adenine-specific DNA-methyltransferase
MEYRILIASLIDSMDRVANTAGTYYAYLKKWYRKALADFEFRLIPPTPGPCRCTALLADASDVVRRQQFDILYLDPPYNDRDYASYYHLPESIARSESPPVTGWGGLPMSVRPKSQFTCRRTALGALAGLLDVARCRLLMFHYSEEGLIRREDLIHLLRTMGRVRCYRVDALGYSTRPFAARQRSHLLYTVYNA